MGVKFLLWARRAGPTPMPAGIAQRWDGMTHKDLMGPVAGQQRSGHMPRYRLRRVTVAVRQSAAQPVAIYIPAFAVLEVPEGAVNSSGFAEVEWDGKSVRMFAVDLRDRGELIKARSA